MRGSPCSPVVYGIVAFLLLRISTHPLSAQTGAPFVGFGDLSAQYTRAPLVSEEPIDVDVLGVVDEGPNSDGALSKKYIEVDLTQQKMYLFHNGTVKQSYAISSGLDYPTPTGKFIIFNKATNAYSSIYHVWMPYWLGFYVDPKLHASFGIHELPYWYSKGVKIRRPRENIGSPHTGGCIALDIGKAKEVYMFADIGTPMYIFD